MNDTDAFLAAIIAQPEDDLPRLVFADWVEEQGDSDRAEFIRIQCETARDGHSDETRSRLESRTKILLTRHRDRWIVPGIPGSQSFRRGFVEHLHISADHFLKHEATIASAAPVFGLRLSVAAGRTSALVRVAWLARMRQLEIHNDGMAPRLRDWFRPNAFPELQSLSLRNNRLWAESIAVLASQAAHLPKLERLDLSGNPMGNEGFAHLATAPALAGLKELILRSDDIDVEYAIGAAGLTALADSPTLSQLRSLNLAGQNLRDDGFVRLVRSPVIRQLHTLDISRNSIGEDRTDWIPELLQSPHLANLRYLNLSRNPIPVPSERALTNWTANHPACTVDLRGCDMVLRDWIALRNSPYARQFLLDEDA